MQREDFTVAGTRCGGATNVRSALERRAIAAQPQEPGYPEA